MNKPVIGIVGLGFVGGSVLKYYQDNGYEVRTFDTEKECTGEESFKDTDIIFVCVPTPYKDGKCDISALEDTFRWIPEDRIVIIKSTVPPGTTEMLATAYVGTVIFNPEFLDASKAEYDYAFPERQILGYASRDFLEVVNIMTTDKVPMHVWEEDLFTYLPKASRNFEMTAEEAECVKYMGNTFFAMKNVFANMWYDYCTEMGIDYNNVREAVGAEPRIGYVHLQAIHKKGRGAGGSCLPKDLAATINFMKEKEVDIDLLETVKSKNDQRLKDSNKTEFHNMYTL